MPHRAVGSALSQLHRPLWTLLKPWSEPWSEGLGIMNPWVVCVSIYMYMCLYVSLCVSLTSYAYFYVSLCMFICVCLCASMCLCVSVIVGGVYVCVTVCLRMHLSVCLCPCTVAGASLELTLRGRGLLVHVYTLVARLDQWCPVERSLVVRFIHPTKHHLTAFRLHV